MMMTTTTRMRRRVTKSSLQVVHIQAALQFGINHSCIFTSILFYSSGILSEVL